MKGGIARILAAALVFAAAACGTVQTASEIPAGESLAQQPEQASSGLKKAVFAGGCFWGVEAVFEHVKGVKSSVSGYAGGASKTAEYERVGRGDTGHAESVEVTFDPAIVSYDQLLDVFFTVAHDPTQLNRQGPDTGPQYRSAIFYTDEDQHKAAGAYLEKLRAAKTFPQPIVTEISPLKGFYPAESYHQNYLKHHLDQPYIIVNDLPKLEALKEKFPTMYRDK